MRIIILFFLCCTCSPIFCQTQAEMNEESFDSYEKADKELNKIYNQILREYKEDTILIKNLKASQRIWIKFRDAELDMKYPERGPAWYGSMHPMCIAGYLEELTRERTKKLKEWLNGIAEGEGCAGSIKQK